MSPHICIDEKCFDDNGVYRDGSIDPLDVTFLGQDLSTDRTELPYFILRDQFTLAEYLDDTIACKIRTNGPVKGGLTDRDRSWASPLGLCPIFWD